MTTKRLAVAAAAVLLALVGTAAVWRAPVSADASANAASSGVTATPSAEGWYETAQCALPTGCGALGDSAPANPYPADTLHVGVVAGTETDRSYVAFALDSLPADASVGGGTLTVPLDTATQDGSQSADTAHIDACLVTVPITKARASFATPPPADCDTRAPATYTDTGGPPRLVVDLTAIARAWSSTTAAVALVPSQQAIDGHETWHIVFSSRDRADAPSPPASASITYTTGPASVGQDGATDATGAITAPPPQASTELATTGALATPVGPTGFVSDGLPPVASPAPPAGAAAPAAPPAPAASATAVVAAAGFEGRPYQYPLVWLVPLAVLIGCGSIGRALTKDLRA